MTSREGLFVFLILLPAPSPSGNKVITPKGYVCARTAEPLAIDGVMNERAWRTASWTDAFLDIEGIARPRPRFRTRVKMLWDNDYLYFGAELQEPHVNAVLTKRDTVIYRDNDFEVFIDPDGDNHEYYELEMNALNTVWDLFLEKPYRDGGPPLDSWDIAGLRTAVCVRGTINNPSDIDTGWSVEIAMPWKALGEFAHRSSPPGIGDQWRVNFSRVEWRQEVVEGRYRTIAGTKEDNWVWSPQGLIDMHWPEMWGYVQFAGTRGKQSEFRPDPARRAKEALYEIYVAQREYRKNFNHWAPNLDELGLASITGQGLTDPPGVSLTSGGYLATATAILPGGRKETWFIRQDSRLWREGKENPSRGNVIR